MLERPLILYLLVTKPIIRYVLGHNAIERLCCALVRGAKKLRQYILYDTICLISKLDSLKYICEKPYFSSRITRWKELLAKYDIVYIARKVVKESTITNHLVDNVVEDYEPLNFDLPAEDVLEVDDDGEMND
jgi:hypothetical protein